MFPNLSIKFEYPDLPVVNHRETFLEQLKTHQVIIVQADTGSGKSTQLPKMLLESGLYENGKIGVTQPRRLAALSIADRLREELKDESLVSSKIRFFEEGPENAPIKVMTDGILLQEFRKDRLFKQYSVLLIDEAHERSLNIDILLGILKQVLAERPEFKLVIASATMDSKLFGDFFGNAFLLEAEGRLFPVNVEYRDPLEGDNFEKGDSGVLEDALEAILDLETRHRDNLLCFLPTERDIQDLALMLEKELDNHFEVLPLFGRMSPSEQKKVFRQTSKTRIVLATNIAETSLTIPGIAYVVDSGTARISRYNPQARIQGLPVEKISQASAKQRMGRAGRVKPGTCIRLYSEKEFLEREFYTEPEIRRSNLANVILQLRSLGISAEEFEFIQSPLRSAFRGAYKALFELGAITSPEANSKVTAFGREMSNLPMDVALSAVLLHGREMNVLQAAIIVCAALSLQDVRITPQEEIEKNKARECHRKFGRHKSDFLLYLTIWNSFTENLGEGSLNKLRKYCEKNYLHFLRCREWIDLYEQYCRILKVGFQNRVCPLDSFHRDHLHIALLYGFFGGVAKKITDRSSYQLVGGREVHVFPGSDLASKNVEWLVSAEVRETSRVFLTKNAEIRPEWILKVGSLFCSKRYYAPTWNRDRGFVDALEEVIFKGMVISRGNRVDYSKVNPSECAEIFFREAIVNMDLVRPFAFMEHNKKVLDSLASLEKRMRRFGLTPSEDYLVDFYVSRASDVCSIKSLKSFIEKNTDKALRLKVEDFLVEDDSLKNYSESFSGKIDFSKYAQNHKQKNVSELGGAIETIRLGNRILQGELVFDASRSCDGLNLKVPVDMVSSLSPGIFALEIDRWRLWIIESFIKNLPREKSKKAKEIQQQLADLFFEELEKDKNGIPLNALSKAIKNFQFLQNNECLVYPEKEFHLNLHLSIQENGKEIGLIDLSPEWGSYTFFAACRFLIPEHIFDLPFGNYFYGFQGHALSIMERGEAIFYRELQQRMKSLICPENTNEALDRIALLESCGAKISSESLPTPREWIVKSLVSSFWEPLKTERFSGLEFAKAMRIKSLKDLSKDLNSQDLKWRAGLSRACYESALLGGNVFTVFWNHLKTQTKNIRQGKPLSLEWRRLATETLEASSVYNILCLVKKFLKNELQESLEFPDLPVSSVSLEQEFSAKKLRENLRPYLQKSMIREEEKKEIREILSKLESLDSYDETFMQLYLKAKTLEEKFIVESLRKFHDLESETIDENHLEKLRSRFGKI